MDVVFCQIPACGASRSALELIRQVGVEPRAIDHLTTPSRADPTLLNRPTVVTPMGVKRRRPSETVLDLLPADHRLTFFAREAAKC